MHTWDVGAISGACRRRSQSDFVEVLGTYSLELVWAEDSVLVEIQALHCEWYGFL
eukprot:CAMPEP_0194780990 /NCGR_PEP_ID=MMETSP0323_2-20130528/75025_1 /TAXON_ID=2866 ORGANISM="Crypthecodinium cohnii, Strain Seligo" /NCGR_SAMPLE_ID=MMETSP0323_2 /ASSEMBLY_ACC=CAM_ASM_000346 /LENGTH=54 /DNA_ID=CAMNT_0039719187 /DNA_START=134 /DNA_END=301 /DNA_ORIENTATION=-